MTEAGSSARATRGRRSRPLPRRARLIASADLPPIPCTMSEIGGGRALIHSSGWLGIPRRFRVQAEESEDSYECVVIGRRGNALQVTLS